MTWKKNYILPKKHKSVFKRLQRSSITSLTFTNSTRHFLWLQHGHWAVCNHKPGLPAPFWLWNAFTQLEADVSLTAICWNTPLPVFTSTFSKLPISCRLALGGTEKFRNFHEKVTLIHEYQLGAINMVLCHTQHAVDVVQPVHLRQSNIPQWHQLQPADTSIYTVTKTY